VSKVFGFGAATLDFRIQTADYGDTYKDKLLAQKTMVFGGGAVANFLTQVARLGGETAWIGKLGDDIIGRQTVEMLKDEGVDCSGAIFSSGYCSPFNVAVYTGPEMRRRGGFVLPNSLATLTDEEIETLSFNLKPHDYVVIEVNEIPLDQTIKFMCRAKERGAIVVTDIDVDPLKQCCGTKEQFDEICFLSQIIVPNIVAMNSLYPEVGAEELAVKLHSEYNKTTIVTDGSRGAFFISEENALTHCSSIKVEVVDTIGAGDAFRGGLIFALSKAKNLPSAVEFGCICGALNCTGFGARTAMPDLYTVEKYLGRKVI